jgi:predicted phosphodiesterase
MTLLQNVNDELARRKEKPIYCASDFHLGYEGADPDTTIEFLRLAQTRASQLVLCGDTFDTWVQQLVEIQKEPAYAELVKTAAVVPTTLVWGNHDYDISGKVPFRVTDAFVQDGILFCHGWRFDIEQRLGRPFYRAIIQDFPWIYQRFFKKPIGEDGEGDPDRARLIHEIAYSYAKSKGHRYVVMGHTHCAGTYKNVYDCGRYGDTYVVIEHGKPRVVRM